MQSIDQPTVEVGSEFGHSKESPVGPGLASYHLPLAPSLGLESVPGRKGITKIR